MADDRSITKKQWIEIAAVAFFVALIAYLIRLWMSPAYASSDDSAVPTVPPSGSVSSIPPITIPSIGIPNIQLPGSSNGNCCCDDGGCAAGSTFPTISGYVNQGNAALAAIQGASNATAEAIVKLGNMVQNDLGGNIQFELQDGASVS